MSNFNLSIKPSQIEIVAKPGSTIIQAYEITNHSDNTLVLTPSIIPWLPSGLDGSVDYLHATPNPNIEFSLQNTDLRLNQVFLLKSGETKQLVLKIKTLNNASLGDSYSTFFISQEPSLIAGDSSQSLASGRLGSHVLISTSTTDQNTPTATITNFKSTPFFKDCFFTPLQFSFDLNNPTDFYFKTSAEIKLLKNDLVTNTTTLAPQNILANYSRHFSSQIKGPFWPGKYTATVSLSAEASAKADLDIFIFPFSIIAPILLLTLTIFVFHFFKHH